jgi:hypothetical protein
MVRYYVIHTRRAKKRVREVKLVYYKINLFSWRKHIIQYTGKDSLQCKKCSIGIMKEKELRSVVSGFGLFEGIEENSQ